MDNGEVALCAQSHESASPPALTYHDRVLGRRVEQPWLALALAVVCVLGVVAAWVLPTRTSPAAADPGATPGPVASAPSAGAPASTLPLLIPMDDDLDVPPVIPEAERARAVFVGDSITRGTSDFTTGALGDWSWFYHLVMAPDAPVSFAGGVADNGMTTTWMASQVWQALSYQPDLLVVLGGTNDIDAGATPEQILGNLESMHQAALSASVQMAVATIPPSDLEGTDTKVRAYNEALRAWAQDRDVIFLDASAPLRGEEGLGWAAGLSRDGTHPTADAARLMSAAAATTLRWRYAEGL